MGDITYESLMAARSVKVDTGEMDLVKMANLALEILEQVNQIKGKGGNVMRTRPDGQGSAEAGSAPAKPVIDVDQILGALKQVKLLKGDIKITELESLLKEHKDQVTMLLGKL